MRQGGKNRSRGRNGRNGHKPHTPMRVQTFDSSGPEVRIRGNAWQVHERYLNMAREAFQAGDRVAAENFFQYADHYYRMVNGEGRPPQQGPGPNGPHPQHQGQHPQQQGQPQQPGQHPPNGYPQGQQAPIHQGQMPPHNPMPQHGQMQQGQPGYQQHPQGGEHRQDDDRDDQQRDRLPPHPVGE